MRSDLPANLGGWQVVDATPQETSDGRTHGMDSIPTHPGPPSSCQHFCDTHASEIVSEILKYKIICMD